MDQSQIKVIAISAFSDNYIWAISNSQNNKVSLVDPGDADVCIAYIEANQLQLSDILITHHHRDHVGGINQLIDYANSKGWQVTVYGPATEDIPQCDEQLEDGDYIELASQQLSFLVMGVFGHTAGHIAFYSQTQALLFCGDTVFSAGCGRLFEGTAEQMYKSLCSIMNLPEKTLVYCAHEYTQANLNFALAVEPENDELVEYYNHVNTLRANGHSTIPTSIAREKKVNPFLRCHLPSVKQSAQEYSGQQLNDNVATFAAIRSWKDNF